MAYADSDYFIRRWGPIFVSASVSQNGTTASMTGSLINDVLDEASSVIDSYCAPYYEIPLTPVQPVLKALTCDIAMEFILIRATESVPEDLTTRIEHGFTYLNDLLAQKIRVPNVETTNEKDPAGHIFAPTSGSVNQKFGVNQLRGKYF